MVVKTIISLLKRKFINERFGVNIKYRYYNRPLNFIFRMLNDRNSLNLISSRSNFIGLI